MKIVYIGCVTSSERFLKSIYELDDVDIVGIVTKSVSHFNADHVSLEHFAVEQGIDWLDYRDNDELYEWINKKEPDLIYCFGWSQLIPSSIFAIPTLGAVGYHPALLPQNRGRHPIIWAIALGLKETGSTFFFLEEEADAGAILNQRKVEINNVEDANSLYYKLLDIGEIQVIEMTKQFLSGTITPVKQDIEKVNYWRKRSKKDGQIEWRMSSESIVRLIKALTKPYVGAHFNYRDTDCKVWKAIVVDSKGLENIEPGKVIAVDQNSFTVKTGDGLLQVIEWEKEYNPKIGEYL